MSRAVLILNGPNLNMLGTRDPEIYGHETLADVEQACRARAIRLGLDPTFVQSNGEGELCSAIQAARGRYAAIVLNAGAYTHTSIAIMDALAAAEVPTYEVHISNIHRRERFRHHSYVARVAVGSIIGLGTFGYELALEAIAQRLDRAAAAVASRRP